MTWRAGIEHGARRGAPVKRLAGRGSMLVVVWLLAWGELSAANLVTGVLLAAALLTVFPLRRTAPAGARVSPLGVVKLVAFVLIQLVPSTLLVAREVVARRSRVRTGVLAHPVVYPSDEVISVIANIIALTPGTVTVEASREPPVLYVHFLLLEDVEQARRSIVRIEHLVAGAFGMTAPDDPSRKGRR